MMQVGDAMATYLTKVEQMYGDDGTKLHVSTLHQWPRSSEPVTSLPDAIKGAMDDIFGDQS
jgi:hypothetical protein